MHKILSFFCSLLFAIPITVSAQQAVPAESRQGVRVPERVLSLFEKHYPNAEDVQWRPIAGDYGVTFSLDNTYRQMRFYVNGDARTGAIEADSVVMPKVVMDHVRRNYAQYRVIEIAQVEDEGTPFFAVELEKDGQRRRLGYDQAGNPLGTLD